jgi:type I restriction enzyme S subunit
MQKLGDYIREVNVRNKDLKVTNLLGLSMSKQFRPSTSNIVGVDLSNYKVVRNNVFAFDPMSVIRVHKVPIALNDTDFPIIVSPAYITFECIDVEKLDPKYLMMWFQRTEFDRYADFKSDAAVRGGYDWKELCETLIIIPSIEQQREIVSEYETISKRIKLNEQIIKNLEATAQTLYHKMFVEGIDKENLPKGWRIGTLGEIAEIISGKTCSDKSNISDTLYKYPVAGASGIIGYSKNYNYNEKIMTTGRVGTLGVVNRYDGKMYMADNVLVIRTDYYEYCYQILKSLDYNEIVKGGVQSLITQTDLKEVNILIPNEKSFSQYEEQSASIYSLIDTTKKENKKLAELQSLLLVKMGR